MRITPLAGNAVVTAFFFDPAPARTTARYVKSDSATAGNWKTVYGDDGNWVAGANASIPAYATVNARSPQWIWAAHTTSYLAPYLPGDTTDRIASCWYSSAQLAFDIAISDGKPHRLSVYFWDASASGRQQRIDLIDLATGAVLDTRTLSNFSKGIYLTWDITGSIGLRATPSAVNAVASALFFDPVP
jgi:hypothetical protein